MGFFDALRRKKGDNGQVINAVTAPVNRLAINSAYSTIQRNLKDITTLDLSDTAIRQAKQQADSGLPMQYYRYILKGVLRDGHIGGVVADLMRRTVAYPYDIILPDEIKNNLEAQEQVRFLKMSLSKINLDAVRQRAAWGNFWPTLQEIVFAPSTDQNIHEFCRNSGVPGFVPQIPISITPLPNIYLQSDEAGNLLYIQDGNEAINLSDSKGRFIFSVDPEDEDQLMIKPIPFTELGSQKRVFDTWVDKVYTRLDGRMYRNRFAEPTLDIGYDPVDPNSRLDAEVIYNAYNASGKLRSIKHPTTVTAQYLGDKASATTSIFRDDMTEQNSEVTKGLKGQNMSTEKNSTRATSSTGMSYDDELLTAISATRDQILTEQLLLVIRDLNYSPDKRFPMTFTTILPDEFNASETQKLVESASAMGREFKEGELDHLYRLPANPDRENFVLPGLQKSNPFRI